MSKKDLFSADAERMYVVEQHSLDRIASDLGLNIKTVFAWKQEGNWDDKRLEFIKGKQMFHEELYLFARKLMHSIQTDIDEGRKTDNGQLYTFTRMLPLITKIKEYEDKTVTKEVGNNERKNLTVDELRQIEELLGIRSYDEDEPDESQEVEDSDNE